VLDLPAHELAPHVHHAARLVDVSQLERHQLSRTQPGGGREHDHRPSDGAQALGDGFDLSPGLERSLLREATQRVRDTSFRRVCVDQLPRDGSVKHLPQRLCRFEAMPLRQCPSPGADLLRPKIQQPHLTEREGRLREQPAQFFDRRRRGLMHLEVLFDQLGERDHRARAKPLERTLKSPLRLDSRREPTHLRTLRAATIHAVAVCPHRLPVRPPRPQLQYLTVLCHRGTSLESMTDRGIHATAEA